MNVALHPRSRQSNDTNSNTKTNSNTTSTNTNTSTTKNTKTSESYLIWFRVPLTLRVGSKGVMRGRRRENRVLLSSCPFSSSLEIQIQIQMQPQTQNTNTGIILCICKRKCCLWVLNIVYKSMTGQTNLAHCGYRGY